MSSQYIFDHCLPSHTVGALLRHHHKLPIDWTGFEPEDERPLCLPKGLYTMEFNPYHECEFAKVVELDESTTIAQLYTQAAIATEDAIGVKNVHTNTCAYEAEGNIPWASVAIRYTNKAGIEESRSSTLFIDDIEIDLSSNTITIVNGN